MRAFACFVVRRRDYILRDSGHGVFVFAGGLQAPERCRVPPLRAQIPTLRHKSGRRPL